MPWLRLQLVLALTLLLLGCGTDQPAPEPPLPSIPFREEGTLTFLRDGEPYLTIAIEIADDDSTRARGLMQRTSLPDRSGMLFIFQREEMQSFWMANTQMSLDILFVDADSQIVNIEKYTRPLSAQSVRSAAPAQFVVEVPAGFTDTHGIAESDRIRWTETS
ncbi:MAG: DUF192 domain-containing protein [Bacteroidetes bacterium]|nr:MAG: DUF192 domain-containing protein [Bacteroidota bacterium]